MSDSAALPKLTLILGGARSGKSTHAEALIGERQAVYLATGQAFDAEMAERIRLHRARRGANWRTAEEPMALAEALRRFSRPDLPVLVDCLTLWLSNLLLAERDIPSEIDRLAETLPQLPGPVILVANEVGLGIVPENKLARAFRDHAGILNQRIAALASRVVFVAAGLPMILKDQA
ncbi:bifunctional adenosylcobinamide kinase/adenosylcobinamide-phosphate guanylyltransferase [Telmatospirillum sp. J64-1]|uniref:bifunctional adenosylcobinamide kinase/adenosylcobinamide-phosphate guanylyltransferase n=1 Tax=Telmatospirillum sp. J64-1 TaxID=2502183 RepID=UPI00115EFB06|nr:bifunctional adenosylcobinamide kinase/adenosylcobinamide-phosphate guanylyltransferase [Telmatospirillum sp. J64-1]